MTDITELVRRMRGLAEYVDDCDAAADALEAQAKEIEELKKELNAWHESANWPEKSPGQMRARIAELEVLLKDCADELEARLDEDYKRSDGSIIPEHRFKYERDMAPVVAARAALNGEN